MITSIGSAQVRDITGSPVTTVDVSRYVYVGYASDTSGSSFTTDETATDRNYFAVRTSSSPIQSVTSSTFDGRWHLRSGVSIFTDQNPIAIPCESDGSSPVFTNARCTFTVFLNGTDDTSNWSFSKQSESSCTATVTSNYVDISGISADSANCVVRASKSGFSNIDTTIYSYKHHKGSVGGGSIDSTFFEIDGGELTLVDGSITSDKIESGIFWSTTASEGSNLNDATTSGVYSTIPGYGDFNGPDGVDSVYTTVVSFSSGGASGDYTNQLLFDGSDGGAMYRRHYDTSSWSNWQKLFCGGQEQDVTSTGQTNILSTTSLVDVDVSAGGTGVTLKIEDSSAAGRLLFFDVQITTDSYMDFSILDSNDSSVYSENNIESTWGKFIIMVSNGTTWNKVIEFTVPYGGLDNYAFTGAANTAEATAGTDTGNFMSPYMTKYVLDTRFGGNSATGLNCRVVNIGDWDMEFSDDGSQSVTIDSTWCSSYWERIRFVSATIRNDAGSSHSDFLSGCAGTTVPGLSYSSSGITLYQNSGSYFDSSAYGTDSDYNRGWVTIWYIN